VIYELFVFGTIWFWILGGLLAITLLTEVVNEKYGWAFVTLAFFAVMLFLFGDWKWSWVKEHQSEVWRYALIYLTGGVILAVIKWWFLVSDAKDKYDNHKVEFLESKGYPHATKVPEDLRETWNEEVIRIYRLSYLAHPVTAEAIIPRARENKDRIIGWMVYWPIVAFWSLFRDVLRRIYETIYRYISKSFQQIAAFQFRGVDEELKFTPKPKDDTKAESPNRR